jgi:TAG lipase / steryl ester hydrolase / phospholipase A2 / LPA acyltransferase
MAVVTRIQLKRSLKSATNYQEWQDAADAYDNYHNLDRWRRTDHSGQFDYISIRARLDRLRRLKAQHDTRGLLFTLNEGIHGNMGGMGRPGLYGRAKRGTKLLIEDYIEEIVDTLDLIARDDSGAISTEKKINFFRRASHCFGHTALMLSGSGSLLYFHVGVAKALGEASLLPNVISGSSGGAIVGAMICTHSDDELKDALQAQYLLDKVTPEVAKIGIPDPDTLHESISAMIPNLSFEQAFEKTGRALNVSIAAAETHQTSRLLNAITTPSVLIRSALNASTAVPGIFPAVVLRALDDHGTPQEYLPQRKWVDGSVSDDLPAKRLARLYGVNHYIVSQTNPHILPFVTESHRSRSSIGLLENAARRSAREWFNAVTLILDKMDKKNGTVTQATSMLRSVVNQDYMGDINILPDYKLINPLTLLSFPGEKQMTRLINSGERCTWPKLEMIRQQTRISRKLHDILQSYEVGTVI